MSSSNSAPSLPANRLIGESSPYLLQHAHNPVDWYPWGEESLALAAREDKPILLSIGYSACHWCHVMAHESFEDPDIAALMNRLFVSVKVDREERPEIDALYMEAVQAMTQHGGWPLTVFLTPEGQPFYGGTYFPPEPRHGLPGFGQVLVAVADAWQDRRGELVSAGERIAEMLRRTGIERTAKGVPGNEHLDRAVRTLLAAHDSAEGGFGGAPKFPQPMILEFLLQYHLVAQPAGAAAEAPAAPGVRAVMLTLQKMAHGGIYDQLGVGFHRYSTDAHWLVPHFEKMLYDNAQLMRTYLHAWQITREPEFRRIVEETADYLLREMTSPNGGFFCAQDADSEGQEGKYFLWSRAEVDRILGPQQGRLMAEHYGMTGQGNFPEGGGGANILHLSVSPTDLAISEGLAEDDLRALLAGGRRQLRAFRGTRIAPGRDEKVLAEWNGLAIHALAEAGAALGRANLVAAAVRAGEFVLDRMVTTDGDGSLRLHRSFKDGEARLNGYLEDYAGVGLGFLALYRGTFEPRWLDAARRLADELIRRFLDPEHGGFFQTGSDHEKLIARRKGWVDNALPSGNSLAAELLLHLGRLLGSPEYEEHARTIVRLMAEGLAAQPSAFGRLLSVLDLIVNPGLEIALVGDPEAQDTKAMLAEISAHYLPGAVLALARPGDGLAEQLPLLRDRPAVGGRATAYVCRDSVCLLPVTDPHSLDAQLAVA